jgi:hypothetical protein
MLATARSKEMLSTHLAIAMTLRVTVKPFLKQDSSLCHY